MTSCDRQTNYQRVTGAFTRALAVLSTNFYCYHEHYHVGEKPLRATRSGIGLHAILITPLDQSVNWA